MKRLTFALLLVGTAAWVASGFEPDESDLPPAADPFGDSPAATSPSDETVEPAAEEEADPFGAGPTAPDAPGAAPAPGAPPAADPASPPPETAPPAAAPASPAPASPAPAAGAAEPEPAAAEPALAEDALETQGAVDEVTVYRDQALVTRRIDIPGPQGLREIVVTDLPESVAPESIFAESGQGVEVRSVRYRIRPVLQDVRAEVRKLDAEIQELGDAIAANARQVVVTGEHKALVEKLEQFTAPTANVELTKGVLNAETLKELAGFLLEQRETVAQRELKLATEQRDLNERMNLRQRERDVLTGGSAKTIREAIVFVNLQGDGGQLRLRYLVYNASWAPSYNVRTTAKREQVVVEYNASIQQMSGEDWTNVEMSLSTATPSLVARAPVLEPLVIALGPRTEPGQQAAASPSSLSGSGYVQAKKSLEYQQREVESQRSKGASQPMANQSPDPFGNGPEQAQLELSGIQQQADFDKRLNDLACEAQVLDLVSEGRWSRSSQPAEPTTQGVSVNYDLADRTSLPSRADRQLIQIGAATMQADFYKVAIPVLTSYVYEEARVVNTGKLVLLPGPLTTYSDGQFVGRGDLPIVAIGESFVIGFGIDSSLRATRELLAKTDAIQGGNRIADFTYQLGIENFGDQPARVRLLERLPTAKAGDVEIELVSTGAPLSEDPAYQADRKKGLLRWEVEVPAQAIGPKAFTLEYKLQVEYDKQFQVSGLPTRQ